VLSRCSLRRWPKPASPVPQPAGDIVVSFEPCPGSAGDVCSDPLGGRIWLAGSLDPFELAHELGHVYLERDLDDHWRGRIAALLGYDPRAEPWSTGLTADDCLTQACPSELAADAYAACALRLSPKRRVVGRGKRRRIVEGWQTAYGYQPTLRQHRRVCRTIRASGQRWRMAVFHADLLAMPRNDAGRTHISPRKGHDMKSFLKRG
jgi:hypothetical protein